jgi:hypothetical protein
MSFRDALLIPALLLPLIPAGIMWGTTGHWEWFVALLGFFAFVGGLQVISKKRTGNSMSRNIAALPAGLFWSIIGTWSFMHILLTAHWILMR